MQPKHPRQQLQCWVMMLAFSLKLLMIRFFISWLGVFLFFDFFFLEEFKCKAKSVFFSPPLPPCSTPPPPHLLLDLELSCVEPTASAECSCLSLNGLSHLLQKMNTKCLRCRRIPGSWAQSQPAVICFRHASISALIKRATLWQQHVSPIQVA